MNIKILSSNLLISVIFFILFLNIQIGDSARGGSSSRGSSSSRSGSSRSGSSFSRSSSRISTGSRFTSRIGSSSSSIFRFSRTATSRTGSFSYGSYSGTRYGTAIRRTVFWPVRRVVYGSRYYSNNYNRVPAYSNSDVTNNIVISDVYNKIKTNETGFSYDCSAIGKITITCFEPPEDQTDVDMANDPDLEIFDGGCCEDTSTGLAVCCVIGINDDASKAKILKQIFISSILLITTSLLLLRRCCR